MELLNASSEWVCPLMITTLSDEPVEEACADWWLGDRKGGTPAWAIAMYSTVAAFAQRCSNSVAIKTLLLGK